MDDKDVLFLYRILAILYFYLWGFLEKNEKKFPFLSQLSAKLQLRVLNF